MAKWREHRFQHEHSMSHPTTLETRIVSAQAKPEGAARVKAETPESDWQAVAVGVDPADETAVKALLAAVAEEESENAGNA